MQWLLWFSSLDEVTMHEMGDSRSGAEDYHASSRSSGGLFICFGAELCRGWLDLLCSDLVLSWRIIFVYVGITYFIFSRVGFTSPLLLSLIVYELW